MIGTSILDNKGCLYIHKDDIMYNSGSLIKELLNFDKYFFCYKVIVVHKNKLTVTIYSSVLEFAKRYFDEDTFIKIKYELVKYNVERLEHIKSISY